MKKAIAPEDRKQLTNEKASFTYGADGLDEIWGSCKMDTVNQPRCYTRTKRGIKKAWAALEAAWNDDMTMYDGMTIIMECGVRMNSYCAVD